MEVNIHKYRQGENTFNFYSLKIDSTVSSSTKDSTFILITKLQKKIISSCNFKADLIFRAMMFSDEHYILSPAPKSFGCSLFSPDSQ